MKNKVLCFGEVLIRMQATSDSFFPNKSGNLNIYPGGSEANVAVSLAQMGSTSKFFTAVPKDHSLASEVLGQIESYGVDTSLCKESGKRIGSYILLSANGLTKGEVIYDRAYSSFSELTLKDLDFNSIFQGCDWFHWTALTPALNQQMATLMKELLKEASNRGLKISVDLNYRSKLWQYGKAPHEVMPELLAYCDVIMGNIWAANTFLQTGVKDDLNRDTPQEVLVDEAVRISDEIFESMPKCQHIAHTFRFMDNPKHNLLYGTYHTRGAHEVSKTRETNELIDRIGSGDAFMAGLIHAIRQDYTPKEIIEYATGSGFAKLFEEGDFGNGKQI